MTRFLSLQDRTSRLLIGIAAAIFLLCLSLTDTGRNVYQRDALERMGWFIVVACIAGRFLCCLHLADRSNPSFPQYGPYSMVRQPLYLTYVICAFGIGLSTGTEAWTLALCILAFAMLWVRSLIDEACLQGEFGQPYRSYRASVPKWLPRFSLWRECAIVEVPSQQAVRILLQSLSLALIIPAMEFVEWLHSVHVLPTLVHIR